MDGLGRILVAVLPFWDGFFKMYLGDSWALFWEGVGKSLGRPGPSVRLLSITVLPFLGASWTLLSLF